MLQRLTRRQFGQIAIAGSTVAAIAALTGRTLAQTRLVIIGVRPSSSVSGVPDSRTFATANDATNADTDNAAPASTSPSSTRRLEVQSFDVSSGRAETPIAIESANPVSLHSGELITGLATLNDGTLLVAITPVNNSSSSSTRLRSLSTSSKDVTVSGLTQQEALTDLLTLNDGSLVGLVVRKDNVPPMRLVNINPQSGQTTTKFNLPEDRRFGGLAQCPDGAVYTTSVARDGATSLVRLDLGQNQVTTIAQLRLDDAIWNNGVQSIACTSASQLFVLGSFWHETRQFLHVVDVKTGNMTRLQAYDVWKMTVSRT